MSFDLSSFGAPAPESRVQPAAASGEGRTLTVRLRRATVSPVPMAGNLTVLASEVAASNTLHAGVVPAHGAALTLTLQKSGLA